MKATSLPNLNRETTSFPNFFTFYQDVDHDDDMTINDRPNIDHGDDTEASETSPFNDILSLSLSLSLSPSPLVSSNESGFLAAPRSVMMFRRESTLPTSSVGSNQFSGGSGARSEGTSAAQLWWDPYNHPDFPEDELRRAFNMRSSEKKLTPIEELASLDLKTGLELTEALRLQMDVQKRLNEQLEIQRNIQLRLEKQAKYLQMMFEKQYKSGDVLKKTSSVESPSGETKDVIPNSPAKDESGISKLNHEESEDARVNAITMASVQVSRKLGEKQKLSESEVSRDVEANDLVGSSSQPSKRAKSAE